MARDETARERDHEQTLHGRQSAVRPTDAIPGAPGGTETTAAADASVGGTPTLAGTAPGGSADASTFCEGSHGSE